MDSFETELKVGFLDEAAQGITDVEQCFLDLETDPSNQDTLNKIFRLAHNLKGSSRAVGFENMGEFTHEFESFILKVKNGELSATPKVINLLLRANDHLREMVEAYRQDLDAVIDSEALMREMVDFDNQAESENSSEVESGLQDSESIEAYSLSELSENKTSDLEKVETNLLVTESVIENASVDVSEIDFANHDLINELKAQLGNLENNLNTAHNEDPAKPIQNSAPEKIHENTKNVVEVEFTEKRAPIEKASNASSSAGTGTGASAGAGASNVVEQTLRVSLSKVENLINFVGEMVILQSVLKEQLDMIDSPLIKKSISQMGKVSKEIQDLAMGLRMVPIKPTFQKMQRIVRDTAQALNKDVAIILTGEETELDKTVLERINDPLVHLVRNAVDHGVESTELRLQKGKPSKGRVGLSAYHQAGRLMIEINDDGGGLDPEKLKAKAIEKKVIRADARLSDSECYQLIFAPGFSTKDQVTDISGRGVGMDVVRTNITDLGGEIFIESHLNQGTTFKISLPLTLAIIESMVLTFSDQRFVIPLGHVFETLKPTPNMLSYSTDLGDILLLREEPIPIYRLGDFFGIPSKTDVSKMIALVVRSGRRPLALLVDDILGQQQVVIKQLTPELSNIKGVSGTTILGDGKPSFIIEPAELVKRKLSKTKPLIVEAV